MQLTDRGHIKCPSKSPQKGILFFCLKRDYIGAMRKEENKIKKEREAYLKCWKEALTVDATKLSDAALTLVLLKEEK